jgi:hypothetical protein
MIEMEAGALCGVPVFAFAWRREASCDCHQRAFTILMVREFPGVLRRVCFRHLHRFRPTAGTPDGQSNEGTNTATLRCIPSMRFPGPANGKAVFHRIDREYVDLQKGLS